MEPSGKRTFGELNLEGKWLYAGLYSFLENSKSSQKKPEKPILHTADSLEKYPLIPSLPKLSKDPVPLSPLRSKKSKLNPSQFALPKISLEDITPKNINVPKINTPKKLNKPKIKNSQIFSKPLNLPVRELPETMQSALQKVPSITQVQPSDKLGTNLREIFPDKIKFDEPIPDLGIPEQADETKLKEIPDPTNSQRKKLVQLAGKEYNQHIGTRIVPKLGSYSSELYTRIRLTIAPSGKIIDNEIIEKSGFAAFDKAAELAVRNALLDPLPNALAENPPYIVTIRIVPQN
jgi:TonB family protein